MEFIDQIGESALRFGIFALVFGLMAAYEFAAPRRGRVTGRGMRWFTNLSIVIIDMAAVRIVFPLATVGAALWAHQTGWGLFNIIAMPGVVAGILSYLILDVVIWGQHVLSHKIPVLWRLHRVHHSDVDFDVTTALRFHPIEIVLSMALKIVVVIAFGVPPLAAFIFEAVLNGMAMFNHANVNIPSRVDRWLRKFIVTPDMHRVHHSIHVRETDSNFGFSLSWWDMLFATYIAQPRDGHRAMRIGLAEHQDLAPTRLGWSLWFPFASEPKRRETSGREKVQDAQ